jgi:hypothetical protein
MKFTTYIILGVIGVFIASIAMTKLMHTDLINYKGSNAIVLFLTRDISDEGRQYGPRVFTIWNLSHVLYFAVGSYIFPDKRLLLWTLGLLWEVLEKFVNVMNPLDIVWNTIGVLIGAAI